LNKQNETITDQLTEIENLKNKNDELVEEIALIKEKSKNLKLKNLS